MELDERLMMLEDKLKALGIPLSAAIVPGVQINRRAKRRLGCCIYRGGMYTIEVSERILENEGLLEQTLLHELLHTCQGCRNHGVRWKQYALRVNEALGCSIERTVPLEGEPETLRREQVNYILECQDCGVRFPRSRLSKLVKYPSRYRCRCGGKLKRIL